METSPEVSKTLVTTSDSDSSSDDDTSDSYANTYEDREDSPASAQIMVEEEERQKAINRRRKGIVEQFRAFLIENTGIIVNDASREILRRLQDVCNDYDQGTQGNEDYRLEIEERDILRFVPSKYDPKKVELVSIPFSIELVQKQKCVWLAPRSSMSLTLFQNKGIKLTVHDGIERCHRLRLPTSLLSSSSLLFHPACTQFFQFLQYLRKEFLTLQDRDVDYSDFKTEYCLRSLSTIEHILRKECTGPSLPQPGPRNFRRSRKSLSKRGTRKTVGGTSVSEHQSPSSDVNKISSNRLAHEASGKKSSGKSSRADGIHSNLNYYRAHQSWIEEEKNMLMILAMEWGEKKCWKSISAELHSRGHPLRSSESCRVKYNVLLKQQSQEKPIVVGDENCAAGKIHSELEVQDQNLIHPASTEAASQSCEKMAYLDGSGRGRAFSMQRNKQQADPRRLSPRTGNQNTIEIAARNKRGADSVKPPIPQKRLKSSNSKVERDSVQEEKELRAPFLLSFSANEESEEEDSLDRMVTEIQRKLSALEKSQSELEEKLESLLNMKAVMEVCMTDRAPDDASPRDFRPVILKEIEDEQRTLTRIKEETDELRKWCETLHKVKNERDQQREEAIRSIEEIHRVSMHLAQEMLEKRIVQQTLDEERQVSESKQFALRKSCQGLKEENEILRRNLEQISETNAMLEQQRLELEEATKKALQGLQQKNDEIEDLKLKNNNSVGMYEQLLMDVIEKSAQYQVGVEELFGDDHLQICPNAFGEDTSSEEDMDDEEEQEEGEIKE